MGSMFGLSAWARQGAFGVILGASLLGGAFAQDQHAAQIAGYWTTDARWQSTIRSKTRQDYFWVGRMWGRIDSTGKTRFDADNGCIAIGLVTPKVANYSWSGTVSVSNCQASDMDGRYEAEVSGGKPHLSLRFQSQRVMPQGKLDVYEANGAFAKYNPLGGMAPSSNVMPRAAAAGVSTPGNAGVQSPYIGRVKALIQAGINRPIGGLPEGPVTTSVEIRSSPAGRVMGVRLVRASGSQAWDAAVMGAAARTGVLPRDVDGRTPQSLVVSFSAKE